MKLNKKIHFYKNYVLKSLNKDDLLKDEDLAVGLARWNRDFGGHELAQDFDVLSLSKGQVALELAEHSVVNGWGQTEAVKDLRVLKLCDRDVALMLALFFPENSWSYDFISKDPNVFGMCFGRVGYLCGMGIKDLNKVRDPVLYKRRTWKEGDSPANEKEAIALAYKHNIKNPVWVNLDNLNGVWTQVISERGLEYDRRSVFEIDDISKGYVERYLGEEKEEKLREISGDDWENQLLTGEEEEIALEWVTVVEGKKIDFETYLNYREKMEKQKELDVSVS